MRTLAAILDRCSLLASHAISEVVLLHWVEAWEVFRRMVGILVMAFQWVWVVIGWLGFVVH